jgi:biopolymer transport protein ExbD
MNFRRGRLREEPEINLIPLIDVLLVILIFLMVTTTYQHFSEMQINLPQGQGDMQKEAPQSLLITVSADGAMKVANRSFAAGDDKSLLAVLKKTAASRADTTVVIAADGKATHQSVVSIMEAAREAGLTQLTFATRTGGHS